MASIAEKLYPPTIGSSIPAFYALDDGTAEIAVPFSMNRAVYAQDVKYFTLKIKTAQSNTFLKTLDSAQISTASFINNRVVKFTWSDIANANIRIGQYLKIQLAYVGMDDKPGYFSTVGVIKYTSKPKVYIQDALAENGISSFLHSYVGVYETTEDKSERPYSYNFYLYDNNKELVETSGWQLHNTHINNALSLNSTIDTYQYQTTLQQNKEYYLQYGVQTINNLEVFSPLYPCIELSDIPSSLQIKLQAENVFEEAYINLSFVLADGVQVSDLETLTKPVSVEVSRAEVGNGPIDSSSLTNYTWNVIRKAYFTSYEDILDWTFKDFTIEQGVKYLYCFRQYSENNIYSGQSISNRVEADFEDMFLWDGERQLKIRFNPKVSSFKANRLEQKIDTIGSRFPFIFRNGIIDYKEFPIGGLISYITDNNELFLNHQEDLNIVLGNQARRLETPVDQTKNDIVLNNNPDKSWENTETLNSVGYNMRAERRFKMKLLEWLGDGKLKLFKSAAEGNYLVRLMNISLTPEDQLGRMLHNFTATAYEMEEITYSNLVNLGFINVTDTEEKTEGIRSIKISDIIRALEGNTLPQVISLNSEQMVSFVQIEASEQTNIQDMILRLGESKFQMTTTKLTLESQGLNFEDLFIYIDDYPSGTTKDDLIGIFGDTVLTYRYVGKEVKVGDLLNIDKVYSKNVVASYFGDYVFTTGLKTSVEIIPDTETQKVIESEILKFYTINIQDKNIREISYINNNYYEYEVENNTLIANHLISFFDAHSLYKVYTSLEDWILYKVNAQGNLITLGIDQDTNEEDIQEINKIELIDETDNKSTFYTNPHLNFDNSYYKNISIGAAYYMDCAYQEKITEYKPTEIGG